MKKALLIGGTSHVGKSTLAEALAAKLGASHISTDSLGRHPGRPWMQGSRPVPEHVADHYSSLSVEELLANVLRHYKENIWPTVEKIMISNNKDPLRGFLIIEGSALWPDFVVTSSLDDFSAIWLTAGDQFIQDRIYNESHYAGKPAPAKNLTDKFLQRSLLYNERMMELIKRLELSCLDVEKAGDIAQLGDKCLGQLAG